MRRPVFLRLIVFALLLSGLVNAPFCEARAQPPAQEDGRRVAKDATLALRVSDTNQVLRALDLVVARFGGQEISRVEWTVEDAGRSFRAASLTLRFPVGQFETALLAIRRLAMNVLAEEVSGVDHTDEMIDLQAHLRGLAADRERLASLQEAARSEVENQRLEEELQAVETALAQSSARLQALEESVDWGRISIELEPFIPTATPTLTASPTVTPTPGPTGTPTTWQPGQVYQEAVEVTQSYLTFWLCCSGMFAAVMGLAGWLAWVRQGRRKAPP